MTPIGTANGELLAVLFLRKDTMKRWKIILLSVLLLLIGLLMAAYPFLSNWQYQHRTDQVITAYNSAMVDSDEIRLREAREAAQHYNEGLPASSAVLTDPFAVTAPKRESNYDTLLNLDGSGLMSYIEIPKISVFLPVYHGTKSAVLEQGIGHLDGSSLPVGGPSTRCVLTGHTGLNRAKLFSDLTELEQGDLFFLHTLEETLAYRVVQIEVVLPEDASLPIVPGEDLCTLITCTPYGINSHRLLVTGERTDYTEDLHTTTLEQPEASSQWKREYLRALCVALLIAAAAVLLLFLIGRRKHHE